jgi:hypothetical protein
MKVSAVLVKSRWMQTVTAARLRKRFPAAKKKTKKLASSYTTSKME